MTTLVWIVVLVGVEVAGPVIAETRKGGTPWHPHHIAERYGLLVIIALGEGMIGTIASLNAAVAAYGWNEDVVLVALAGTALTFGLWWTYFVVPCGDLLALRPAPVVRLGVRSHRRLIGAVVAVGAGLHVSAYYLEHHSELGVVGSVLAVAIPVAVYVAVLYALYALLTRTVDPFHAVLMLGTRCPARAPGADGGLARVSGVVPDRARAVAVGHRGRLRGARSPAQRGGAGAAAPRGRGHGGRTTPPGLNRAGRLGSIRLGSILGAWTRRT